MYGVQWTRSVYSVGNSISYRWSSEQSFPEFLDRRPPCVRYLSLNRRTVYRRCRHTCFPSRVELSCGRGFGSTTTWLCTSTRGVSSPHPSTPVVARNYSLTGILLSSSPFWIHIQFTVRSFLTYFLISSVITLPRSNTHIEPTSTCWLVRTTLVWMSLFSYIDVFSSIDFYFFAVIFALFIFLYNVQIILITCALIWRIKRFSEIEIVIW